MRRPECDGRLKKQTKLKSHYIKIRQTDKKNTHSNLYCKLTSAFNTLNSEFQCGIFHSRQQFYHELRCNYKLCSAQLKVEDVSVSEQTSTAVCQRANRRVKWGLHDLHYVLSLHQTPTSPSMEHKYAHVCMCVLVCLVCLSVSFSQVLHPVAPPPQS